MSLPAQRSSLRLYVIYMAVTTIVALSFALFQLRFVLNIPLAELSGRMLLVPTLLGLSLGYLIATVMQLQRKHHNLSSALLKHDRLLEHELEERRRTEDRLRNQTQELRAANHELESFGYAISHDLRAPLRRIAGFSEALANLCVRGQDTEARQLYGRIERATDQMHEMIDALLDLSRITGVQLQRLPTNLSAIAHDIIAELQAAEPQRKIQTDIQPGLIVHADPRLLRHVLENLIGNAWKFTAHEALARIEIGCEQQYDKAVFYVRDNGIGFDPQYTDQIFLPFRRLHTQQEFEGSGVGLATVQRIIQRHGGWVRAQGEVNRGSEISFCLESSAEPYRESA